MQLLRFRSVQGPKRRPRDPLIAMSIGSPPALPITLQKKNIIALARRSIVAAAAQILIDLGKRIPAGVNQLTSTQR